MKYYYDLLDTKGCCGVTSIPYASQDEAIASAKGRLKDTPSFDSAILYTGDRPNGKPLGIIKATGFYSVMTHFKTTPKAIKRTD